MVSKCNDGHLKFSIRITVVGMFLIVTTMTAAVAIGLQYHFSSLLAGEAAVGRYRQAAVATSDHLASVDSRA